MAKSRKISIRLPDSLYSTIDYIAYRLGVTKSDVIREIIASYFIIANLIKESDFEKKILDAGMVGIEISNNNAKVKQTIRSD